MGQPTIKDVAKLAGVSISTVSRVMNDSKPVSPEARRKVLDAINKLDFKPNQLARSLVMRKSNMIGVIVEDIGIEYMAQLIRGVEEIGHLYKYDIILSSTYHDQNALENSIRFLSTKQVEGIIVISEDISPEVLVQLKESKIPFILLDRFYNFKNLTTVTLDYEEEEYKLAKFLDELGHKKIAYIGRKDKNFLSNRKVDGYTKFINEKGESPLIIEADGITSDNGYNVGEEALKVIKENNVTAVSCINDEVAIGFINYCFDHNINVPKDLSVVGFGDSSIAKVFRPKLTTISIPYYDMGAIAIRALIKRIRNEDEILAEDWIMDGQLEVRDTSRKIWSWN